jgi:hypothetical protein
MYFKLTEPTSTTSRQGIAMWLILVWNNSCSIAAILQPEIFRILEDISQAYDRVANGQVRFRAVIKN